MTDNTMSANQTGNVIHEVINYWCNSIYTKANPKINFNRDCPYSESFVAKSIFNGYKLTDSALETFKEDLEQSIINELVDKDKVVLATDEKGPLGILQKASTKAGIPRDLFLKNVLMYVSPEGYFTVQGSCLWNEHSV